jgi:hypothetical protein
MNRMGCLIILSLVGLLVSYILSSNSTNVRSMQIVNYDTPPHEVTDELASMANGISKTLDGVGSISLSIGESMPPQCLGFLVCLMIPFLLAGILTLANLPAISDLMSIRRVINKLLK